MHRARKRKAIYIRLTPEARKERERKKEGG
jgi:hypothetical protein